MSNQAQLPGKGASVMRTPRWVDVDITAHCNLSCRYCYFADNPAAGSSDLSTETWLAFFSELGRLKVMGVTVGGGEALMRSDLLRLIEAIALNRMRWTLVTNGTLMHDQLACSLARIGRCQAIQVSLDGSSPATHDSCRGAGSFVAALQGIQVLIAHRLPVTVRVTLHRHNIHDLEAIAHLLLDELGLKGFSVNSATVLGAGRDPDLAPTIADRQHAMGVLDRLVTAYPGRITAQAGPLAELERWREMETARRRSDPPFADGGRLSGCGCVFDTIAVRADGVLVPCTMLPQLELGHIERDSLEEIWRSSPTLDRLRSRDTIELSGFDYCSGCEHIPYCTGNCPALAEAVIGDLDHPSPDGCLRRFLEGGGRIPEPDSAQGPR